MDGISGIARVSGPGRILYLQPPSGLFCWNFFVRLFPPASKYFPPPQIFKYSSNFATRGGPPPSPWVMKAGHWVEFSLGGIFLALNFPWVESFMAGIYFWCNFLIVEFFIGGIFLGCY